MKLTKMMMLLGGGVLGYWYFRMHPEKIKKMKKIGKRASKKMNSKLDLES